MLRCHCQVLQPHQLLEERAGVGYRAAAQRGGEAGGGARGGCVMHCCVMCDALLRDG